MTGSSAPKAVRQGADTATCRHCREEIHELAHIPPPRARYRRPRADPATWAIFQAQRHEWYRRRTTNEESVNIPRGLCRTTPSPEEDFP